MRESERDDDVIRDEDREHNVIACQVCGAPVVLTVGTPSCPECGTVYKTFQDPVTGDWNVEMITAEGGDEMIA